MDKGSYILLIEVKTRLEIRTRARRFELLPGFYCYAGSALGSLSGRVKRHLKKSKNKFWHIDFLLEKGKVLSAVLLPSSIKREEEISALLQEFGEAVKGFGASDCRASSNLYKIEKEDFYKALKSIYEHMGVFT